MAEFLFKDRVTATPNRIKLTKVAEDTYDVEKIPGSIAEEGTPLSATTMNKLAQKDGTNTALMNTVFTEAATRANIASGETHSTLFGKIKKWFSDLKPHAFNDLATSLGTETDKAPTNNLLNATAALKANATNPNLTGQMLHNGQQFGIYPLTPTETSTNYIKVASIYLNSLGTGNSRVVFHGFLTVGGTATEGDAVLSMLYFKFRSGSGVFNAEIMGYTALKPSTIPLLGTWHYTVNPTTKYVDLYYKPLGSWRNACLAVMGVSKLAGDSLSFIIDNLGNALPYDTGSTSNPDTPSGGQSGTFGFNDYKQFLNQSDISTVAPISSAAASNAKVYSEKLAFDQLALKAPLANPTFTGQIEHTTNLSATNRKLPIGIYQVLPGVNSNYWKVFRISPIRAFGVVLRITNFPYTSNPLCFADISINTYSGGFVNVTGYKYQNFANPLGTLYWTVDITNDVIDFYYKPPTNGAGIGISMSSGYNHSIVNLSFVSDGTHVLPYDTGSTTAPATPEGGTSGSLVYTDYKQLATTDNPTFTGTVTVPTPVNDTDAATKGYADSVTAYDKVIRTQDEFEELIDDPDWLGATSVALVGQFTYDAANNSGIKIPSTVKQIHGFNGAKITITNFVYDLDTAKGGLWYDTLPTTPDYSIRDLEVECNEAEGTPGISIAFANCNGLYNCAAVAVGTASASHCGFHYCTYLVGCSSSAATVSYRNCSFIMNSTARVTGISSLDSAYRDCRYLTNCIAYIGGASNGFNICQYLSNCSVNCDSSSATAFGDITYASCCSATGPDGFTMWKWTNKGIDESTCKKTIATANNTTLNT